MILQLALTSTILQSPVPVSTPSSLSNASTVHQRGSITSQQLQIRPGSSTTIGFEIRAVPLQENTSQADEPVVTRHQDPEEDSGISGGTETSEYDVYDEATYTCNSATVDAVGEVYV